MQQIHHWVFAPLVDEVEGDYLKVHKVSSVPLPLYREYRFSVPTSRLAHQLDSINPDVLQIATPDCLGLFGLRYAKRRQLPVVSVYHTNFPSYLRYYKLGWLEASVWRYLRYFYHRCDVVLAPSERMRLLLAEKGVSGVRLWGRGIEANLFHPRRRDKGVRQGWGGDNCRYVAFLGRLVWYKGLDIFREVYRRLQPKHKELRFVLIGDGPAAPELKKTMPKAIFLGHVDKQEVGRVLASCDLLLFPSSTETFGQSVLESMAVGVPMVVSDVGGPGELVSESQAGIVVKANDVEAFSGAIEKLLNDTTLLEKCRQRGFDFTKNRDWHAINDGIIDIYNELLNGQKAKALSR